MATTTAELIRQLRSTFRNYEDDMLVICHRWKAILGGAEALTEKEHASVGHDGYWRSSFGRYSTKWRLSDEVYFQACVRRLVSKEAKSLLALHARAGRRLAAAEALTKRLRLNEPPFPMLRFPEVDELLALLLTGQGPTLSTGTPAQRAAADPPAPPAGRNP